MINLQDYRIKIFTRSMNYELYCYSQHLITLPFERVRLTETTADGYLYKIIEDKSCDIAINIDEDAFVVNEQAILDLLCYVIENNYANAGMADGGELPIRIQNPIVTNPFFNVLNLKLIRTKFNIKEIEGFDYPLHKEELKCKLPDRLIEYEDGFKSVDFEPYYPFFFWLAYNFNTFYLPAQQYKDGLTTILKNQNNVPILYHTWYSRHFRKQDDVMHTPRILSVIEDVSNQRQITMNFSVGERFLSWYYSQTRPLRIKIKNDYDWIVRHIKKGPRYYYKKWFK